MYENLTRLDLVGPALARALGDPGWERLEASLVSGGKSNLTFELTSDAGEAVLRRPPDGPLLPRAHDMGREARVQQALAGTPVPVAAILFEDGGDLLGVPFYVMEKVDGYVIRGDLPAGWAESAGERCAVADVLIDTLADLHAIDPDAVGLSGYGRPSGLGERQVRRWSDQWERSKSREVPAVDELARLLRAEPPRGPGGAIVHGDFRIDNTLLGKQMPPTVQAVLDWELSTLGEPLADLGLFLFYWREPSDARPALTPGADHAARLPVPRLPSRTLRHADWCRSVQPVEVGRSGPLQVGGYRTGHRGPGRGRVDGRAGVRRYRRRGRPDRRRGSRHCSPRALMAASRGAGRTQR
jgi:aminoglycoside phosphotransferase (APT) family kinase protein